MAKKKNIADRIISGEYDKEWLQENKNNKEAIKQSREEQHSSLKLPTKENTSNIQNQISFKNNNRLPVNNSQNNFQLPVNNRVQNYNTTNNFSNAFEQFNFKNRSNSTNPKYYGKGNIDLNNRKILRNKDGSISTEQSMSFGDEYGNEILVPTIINGKKVSDNEAIDHYYKTGEHLGKFKSVKEAEEYAQALHNRQDKFYNSNVGDIQKETSQRVFEALNPGKKINYDNDSKSEIHIGGVLPYIAKNYKQGLFEGTAGIAQGQLLNASNEAKKISEKDNKYKLKDLNDTLLQTLNPIYGITRKSYEIGQNTLNTLKDKDKTVKQKVADILTNSVSGIKDLNNPIGDVVKLSGKTAGIINNKAGDKLLELNEKIDKPLRENREKLQEEGQNYSNVARMAGTVSNVVGNMTPSIIAGRFGGGSEGLSQALSLGTMGLSAKGRATQEALNKGAELDKAIKIGDTKAMTEVGTELLTGGLNIFGKGALDDIVKRGINRKVESKVLNYLAKQGAGIAGEVGEETISDILNTVIDQGTVDPNATYSMKDWSDTALTTMLSTVVLNALGGAYTPKAYNQNVQEMEQTNAKQDITERINNSNLSEEDKSNMINYVQNEDFTQADYNAMRETIDNNNVRNNNQTQETGINKVENSNKSSFSFDEINSKISNNSGKNKFTDNGITMTYVHMNNQDTQNYGSLYGQNIEPSGEYMNVDIMEGKYKIPNADYGTIHFDNPLVLDHINTGETGWKKTLSEMFNNKTGKELSDAVKKAGYDGIITIDEDGYYNEVVNLKGKKIKNIANNTENNKQKQLDIIQENNPMTDNYHTGIRNLEDIKTFDEVINDEESFVYGDFSKEDAEKALKEGKVTVYSSNPIKQGSFVSTSQNMAKDYAGNGKIYSQEVNLKDVAWINGDEGQYAKIENNVANNQKNIVNNSKKVYNIINKSITNNERAQVSDEVRRWRINQENGLGYIDLSEKGYNSYIYNKQGGNVETILKVNGSEEFKNYIRKGVEDGTFSNAEGFNKSIAEIKNEYRKYRSSNDGMSGRKSNNRNDKLPTRQIRREGSSNTARDIKQNSGNESIENSNKSSFIMPTVENTEINPYRNTGRANKLIKEKNTKIEQLEKNLKQTNSQEEQNNIQQEIKNTEKQYNEQIQTLYDEINNKDNNKEKAPTRHEVIQKNREIARQNIKNIANWNDKKSGIRYQLETMERNMYDIIPDKAEAKRMNDTYFEPIHTAEANKQKFINQYNDRIKKFDLNKYESEAVQVLGEQKYNPSFDAKEAEKALDNVKKNIEKGKIDQEKVDNAIEEFRSIYDELFDLENKVLRDNGYKEKDYRKGYFPHFIDYTPETTSEKILNKLGFKIDKRPLPTDIAGITEQFVPGKTWNRSALQRKTNKTDYNALKGFDTYIAQASDNIFHTENIQRLRGLENEIRYQYSDKGVQKRIDEILNNDVLDSDEKQDMIDAILKQVENPMPNLVTELRRYTNALANKKSEADRSMEQMAGRQVYSTINAIENKFGANAVGLNIGSAVTNFIPITQAWSQIGTKNIARASIDYSKSLIEDDGFVNKSAFLTSRLNQAEKLYQTWSDKATSKANFLFDAIDDVASNIVVRGKYLENIQKGMTETEAIKNADQFARNVIADRSKGALPTKFEEKNPISKAFTQFQLEVNNQYRYMFKDIPRDLKEKGLGAIAIAYLKMFVGAWLYNKFAEKITGRKPAFSPIDLIKSSYDTIKDEKMGTYEKITKIGKDIGEQAPFIGGFLGGGRIPINGALPNIANVTKAGIGLTTGEMDSKKAKETLGKEFSKPLYYLLPPFGGGQLKKSVEGISTVKKGGSYGIDKDGKETLQFPVESKKALNYIKAGVFGKYALPEAKTYTDSGFKGLNAKQTEAYKEIKMPYKEFIDYTNNKLEKTSDKINYINNLKISDDQKWGLYKYDVLSSTLRDDGTSQKSDAEYAINNKLTTKKEYMDLYNKANNNNINMPNTEELKNIKEQGISLKTFVDYKINSKGNKKQSDKIQTLLDSNYSDEEKGSIFIDYINKNDNQYKIMKVAGINIDEYLKYKQQDFESDKVEDGTLKGKSSKNKKDKVINYLNSMNITNQQRLLLYASQGYSTSASQKKELVNYISNLDLNLQDKLDLFNKFSGFEVYKNGKIKY